DPVYIRLLENDFLPCPLSARLFAGLLWPADDCALAKRIEPADQDSAEAAAISDEQRDRRDAPDDPQHGQQAARAVALECDQGFANDFDQHRNPKHPTTKSRGTISFVSFAV